MSSVLHSVSRVIFYTVSHEFFQWGVKVSLITSGKLKLRQTSVCLNCVYLKPRDTLRQKQVQLQDKHPDMKTEKLFSGETEQPVHRQQHSTAPQVTALLEKNSIAYWCWSMLVFQQGGQDLCCQIW